MAVNWDKINKCRLWKILGVSECDDCPSLKKCWGDDVELPKPSIGALEKLGEFSNGSISTHKE